MQKASSSHRKAWECHPDITEVIVDLSEANGKTTMKMVHVGIREGSAGAGGWKQSFDRLGAALVGQS